MKRFEVHEHCYVSGQRPRVVHSHVGGDQPHEHPGTGPASRTIDKDEWFAATGMRGGGRKKFTPKPSGPQLAYLEREAPTYDVVIVGDGGASVAGEALGPGVAVPARLRLVFGALADRIVVLP